MEVIALSRNVKTSPRKLRLVADAVRKLAVAKAVTQLTYFSNAASKDILKTLESAIANSKHNAKLEEGNLKIKNILIDEGFKMGRQDKSHGARFGSGVIHKRAAHIKVILEG